MEGGTDKHTNVLCTYSVRTLYVHYTDGMTNGRTDGRTDGPTDRQTFGHLVGSKINHVLFATV